MGRYHLSLRLGALMLLGAVALLATGLRTAAQAAPPEHPGEHPGEAAEVTVTQEQIRDAITTFIQRDQELKGGYFLIWDQEAKAPLVLKFDFVHDRLNEVTAPVTLYQTDDGTSQVLTLRSEGSIIGTTEHPAYFACVDFEQVQGPGEVERLDLDFFMAPTDHGLECVKILIHKLDGQARMQYR